MAASILGQLVLIAGGATPRKVAKAIRQPVGAYPQGASPYGVLDMAGNMWEWTRSLSGWYPYPSDAKERARREDLQAPRCSSPDVCGAARLILIAGSCGVPVAS